MAPGGRRRENRENNNKKKATTEGTAKKIYKERPALQGVGSRQPVGFVFSKFGRFSGLPVLRRRKIVKERGQKRDRAGLVNEAAPIKEADEGHMLDYLRNSQPTQDEEISKQDPREWTCMQVDTGAGRNFWRDPDAKFCCICGDEEDKHVELMCPYNYLSPASYVPCRARLAVWNYEINKIRRMFRRHKRPSRHDKIVARCRKFLQRFVRVNNLAECCRAEQLVRLFAQFGPLRMYHVAMRGSEICGGFAYMIFEHREHARKAIENLNCCNVDGRNLRGDWAYPSA